MNSETDFVAKNEGFQNLLNELADHLLAAKPATIEEAHASKMENGSTVEEHITSAIAKIGEKLRFAVSQSSQKKITLHSVLTYTWADASVY